MGLMQLVCKYQCIYMTQLTYCALQVKSYIEPQAVATFLDPVEASLKPSPTTTAKPGGLCSLMMHVLLKRVDLSYMTAVLCLQVKSFIEQQAVTMLLDPVQAFLRLCASKGGILIENH